MEVYQTKEGFVLGVNGGEFYSLKSEPEAIILTNRPVPTKLWSVHTLKDRRMVNEQEWDVDTEVREFNCDNTNVYILHFMLTRTEPGYATAIAEFFVSEEYAIEKLESLRKKSRVTEYSWDAGVPTWKEVHRKKYYRKP